MDSATSPSSHPTAKGWPIYKEVGADMVGELIGRRHKILRRLAKGGMADVFLAKDLSRKAHVAIKILRSRSPESCRRFGVEGVVLSNLKHPFIVRAVDVGKAPDGQPYMALEYLEGESLSARLARGPMAWRDVVVFGSQIASAVHALHAAGIVHRDLKPKYRRLSQTAPQPTDRPHSHELGRFERVCLLRLAPHCPALPQLFHAERWKIGTIAAHVGREGLRSGSTSALICEIVAELHQTRDVHAVDKRLYCTGRQALVSFNAGISSYARELSKPIQAGQPGSEDLQVTAHVLQAREGRDRGKFAITASQDRTEIKSTVDMLQTIKPLQTYELRVEVKVNWARVLDSLETR